MVSDPRCPSCAEKVGMTAKWCMHCGAEFDDPVGAETGRPIGTPEYTHSSETAGGATEDSDDSTQSLAVVFAVAALVTFPLVTPENVTLLYFIAVVGVGYYTAVQPTATQAKERGLRALAVGPLGIWLLSPLVVGFEAASLGGVFPPAVYAAIVLSIGKQIESSE